MDPGGSPAGIGLSHESDEFLDLRAEAGPAWLLRTGFPFPEETEAFSVPSENRIRLDDTKRRIPAVPDPRKRDPEETVSLPQLGPFLASEQDAQLLTESQIFSCQVGVETTCGQSETKQFDGLAQHDRKSRSWRGMLSR